MARQTFYLAKDVRHPLYKTRMLQAGPLELDASAARLYRTLGVELSEEAPMRARKVEPAVVEFVAEAEAPKPVAKPKAKRARKK